MKKKFLAVVITAVMLAGAMPAAVFAAPLAENEAQMQETLEIQDVIDDQDKLEAAVAKGGEIDLTGQRIELTGPLTVNNDVVIKGGTLIGTDSVTGNLVTLMGNKVTLEGVTIQTSAGNKSALHAYGTDLTAKGLTIDHSSAAGGAPVIINNGADAVFSGNISLTLGASSWYGINVDNARADFASASLNAAPVTDTQSVICREGDNAQVSGAVLTVVVTEKDGGGNRQQTAYVADSNLAQFVAAKTAAGADVSRIELHKDVTLTAPLVLNEAMTVSAAADGPAVKGSGAFVIKGSDTLGNEDVVTVASGGVKLSRIAIRTTAANKSALRISKADVELNNITLDNTESSGGSAMVIDGGTATVYGLLEIRLGENSQSGIKLETASGSAGISFEDGSSVNLTGNGQEAIIVEDKNTGNTATVTGAEDAGLVQNADGNYVTGDTEADPDEEQPDESEDEDGLADDEHTSDEDNSDSGQEKDPSGTEKTDSETAGNNAKAPKTGDMGVSPYIALTALFGSGSAAGVVLKRRKK